MKILLATWNTQKIKWLTAGFTDLGLEIHDLRNSNIEDVEETGTTCKENALLKVRAIGKSNNTFVIGEDSALSIGALNGFPGVKTVRWAPGTDDDRSRLLLEKMNDIHEHNRQAKFLSSVAMIFPDGNEDTFLGEQPGKISSELFGEEGDGYQRIFISDKLKSVSKSDESIVQVGDHRDIAMYKCKVKIKEWLNNNNL